MTPVNQSQNLSKLHNRIARIRQESANLKQSLEKLRAGADDLYDPDVDQRVCAYWMEPDGTIVAASQALVRLLGYASVDELRARRLDDGEYDIDYVQNMFARHGGQIRDIESVWRRKDGSILHVRESARAIYDDQGRPISYEGIVEPIAGPEQAASQPHDVEAIAEQWPGPTGRSGTHAGAARDACGVRQPCCRASARDACGVRQPCCRAFASMAGGVQRQRYRRRDLAA